MFLYFSAAGLERRDAKYDLWGHLNILGTKMFAMSDLSFKPLFDSYFILNISPSIILYVCSQS